jgi:hypothetical protein
MFFFIQGLPGLAARSVESDAAHQKLTVPGCCLEKVSNYLPPQSFNFYWKPAADPVLRSRVGYNSQTRLSGFSVL